MHQLKKLKGKKLKTALHYLAVLQTNVALMTIGLEDESEDIDKESDGGEENSDNEISDEDKFTDKDHTDDVQSECEDDEITVNGDESDKDTEDEESNYEDDVEDTVGLG